MEQNCSQLNKSFCIPSDARMLDSLGLLLRKNIRGIQLPGEENAELSVTSCKHAPLGLLHAQDHGKFQTRY